VLLEFCGAFFWVLNSLNIILRDFLLFLFLGRGRGLRFVVISRLLGLVLVVEALSLALG